MKAFIDFLQHLPFYGSAVLCIDDPNVRQIQPLVSKPVVTYGTSADAMVRAVDVVDGERMRFRALREGAAPLDIALNLPGRHNVLNALAAIAVATELGVEDKAITTALAEFRGVGRRFQRYGDVALASGGRFTLVDDYGHHPAEMRATIRAARGAFPGRRLVLAFQPHRYTRTRDLFEDFVKVLAAPDVLLLDEPTASLDPARRNELGDVFTQLARSGRALVMTSHDDDFVRDYATRLVVLAHGMMVEQGDPRTVLDAPSHEATRQLLNRRPSA